MEIERLKKIIAYGSQNLRRIENNVQDFHALIGMERHSELRSPMQIIRTLLENMDYIVIEIPFRDKEIGALCYNGDALNYVFLNTALPRCNVNFALCHEIYHIFYQEKRLNHGIDLYMNEHYYDYEEELAANSFAGMLLMPEKSFCMMCQKFKREAKEGDTMLSVISRLMNYYEVPYMAALIRCYELNLLEAGAVLEELLNADSEDVRREFVRLWLDESILEASKKDNYARLELLVKSRGEKYQAEGYLNERTASKARQNMRAIYKRIRGE